MYKKAYNKFKFYQNFIKNWPGCHIIAKVIVTVFNTRTRISVNWTNTDKLQSQTITLDSGFLLPPYPLPNVVLQVRKKIERKVDITGATLKEGKRGRAFF